MNLSLLSKAAIEAEYKVIVDTLKKVDFNKAKAARILGINRSTLRNKLERYKQLEAEKLVTK